MRILVFGERLAPPPDEGIKKLTLNLAAALRELGHDVRTLTTAGADWAEQQVVDLPADRLLRSPQLRSVVAAHRPEVILYVPTASLTLASGLRARMLRWYAGGAPVALLAVQGRRHSVPVRIAARLVAPDLCVALSGATLRQAQRLGWRAVCVPPGVDLEAFAPATEAIRRQLRAAHNLPEDAFIVLHAGHLNRTRGVADLAALTDLAYPMLVASTSTPHDAVLAAELTGAGVHLITHYVPHIAELYRAANAYLFPVPPDPTAPASIDTPLSVLEAAACGLPIIATRFGALPELWTDQLGVHFYDDRASLRAAVVRCRTDAPGTRSLAEPYGWPAVATRILNAIARHSQRAPG